MSEFTYETWFVVIGINFAFFIYSHFSFFQIKQMLHTKKLYITYAIVFAFCIGRIFPSMLKKNINVLSRLFRQETLY